MKYNPHEYQKYAIQFIKSHPIAAIFLDCGMGKTSLTLQAIENLIFEEFEISRVLIVAPLRVARTTWSAELKKWSSFHHMTYSIVIGTAKQRLNALKKDADIYIINRENVQWLVEKSGVPFRFDFVVLDEVSSFKNYSSKRTKAFLKVRPKVKRIVGLTGTPSSNGLMDLFGEFKVLDLGERLGRFIGQYRLNYFKPDQMNGAIVYSYKLLPGAEEQIYDKISDVTISMKSTDYLEMPELVSSEYTVYLDDAEKQQYDAMKKDLIVSLPNGEVTAANAATLSGKLSQMASGAVYGDEEEVIHIHDKKLDGLEDIIEAANGKTVLVAYWYKHDLTRICTRLDALGVVYEKLDTDASIEKWCEGKLQVGLLHPASAGHGLNLQSGGSTMVWFSLPWSLEIYLQTCDRLYRQGQNDSVVKIIHLITDGTIDSRILKALEQKDNTQTALLDAVKAEL